MNGPLTLSIALLVAALGYTTRRAQQAPRPTPRVPQIRNGQQNRWYR